MSTTCIPLNCQSCGGKLEIYSDMDRFACGYCGTEMMVQRRGGTVALKAVTEAIAKVQVGTDRTAAELALVRLETEMKDRKTAERVLRENSAGLFNELLVYGAIFVIFGVVAVVQIGVFGVVLILLGGVLGLAGWGNMTSQEKELARLQTQIAVLKEKIDEKKKIVDS